MYTSTTLRMNEEFTVRGQRELGRKFLVKITSVTVSWKYDRLVVYTKREETGGESETHLKRIPRTVIVGP